MRILTAGESHGKANLAIIEGFPKGVKIDEGFINAQLKRRMSGFGRGLRMSIESDSVEIFSGMRNKITLGSPISLMVKNRDCRILAFLDDKQPPLTVPRPAHADLAGALKYGETDIRNILERASARETSVKVAAGAVCKQFLDNFGIKIAAFTVSCGRVESKVQPDDVDDITAKTSRSLLNCYDLAKEKLMIKEIEKVAEYKDTLGGIVEVWAQGVCPGLGSVMHYDRRLDARLAASMMSIPAIKGVEIGLGFDYARSFGSASHDKIFYAKNKGYFHTTNNSGGIEGGMSNGETIVARIAMKPIATLLKPLDSVDLRNKKSAKAVIERSDTCAVAACAVIAESMAAIVITEAMLEKFGCDSLKEIQSNYKSYLKTTR